MKIKDWKYVWRWNEEYVNCGGQGANSAKDSIKNLKMKRFDCKIEISESYYSGMTLIEIFCKNIKTKRVIQKELHNCAYTIKIGDEFAWEIIK